jgi:CRP/FNR family cyclic AMP-dependent transcriptional regulator
MDDPSSALRSVPLFADLSDRDLKRVLEVTKEVDFEDGRRVVEEDAQAVGFHLILQGSAIINVHGKDVSTFGPGDYFGEMSIIDGKPRSASVTASGHLRTLAIPAWDFEGLMEKYPSIMRALLAELTRRIRRMDQARS